jgi:hypothetical protein
MKPKIAMRSERRMKYFTPELYRRCNSRDDGTADRAYREWEEAIKAYREQLNKISVKMNDNVKNLAEKLCFHDAQLLSSHGHLSARPFQQAIRTWVMSLRRNGEIVNLIYFLWGEARASTGRGKWPFSDRDKHWLYDEVDPEPDSPFLYWHRILLSDGSVTSIPFFDVFVDSFAEQTSATRIRSSGGAHPTRGPARKSSMRRTASKKDAAKFEL